MTRPSLPVCAPTTREELARLSKDELVDLVMRTRGAGASSSSAVATAAAAPAPAGGEPAGKRRRGEARPFDMSRYAQRYVALRVAYVGTRYNGFAYQVDDQQTVEGALLSALQRTRLVVDRESCRWSCGGRTDKGVSALGQVVALKVRSNMPRGHAPADGDGDGGGGGGGGEGGSAEFGGGGSEDGAKPWSEIDYVGVINRCLPDDIRVLGWAPVGDHFSARFSADSRAYKYFFMVSRDAISREISARPRLRPRTDDLCAHSGVTSTWTRCAARRHRSSVSTTTATSVRLTRV